MKINIIVQGRHVMLGFECDTLEQARELGEDIVRQMKRGDLHLTLVEPEHITPGKTEH